MRGSDILPRHVPFDAIAYFGVRDGERARSSQTAELMVLTKLNALSSPHGARVSMYLREALMAMWQPDPSFYPSPPARRRVLRPSKSLT